MGRHARHRHRRIELQRERERRLKNWIHFGLILATGIALGVEGAHLADWSFLVLAVAVEVV